MAADTLPAPGTDRGPCLDRRCTHQDCRVTREMAADVCWFCTRTLGYDQPFYDTPEHGLVHARCYDASLEVPDAN